MDFFRTMFGFGKNRSRDGQDVWHDDFLDPRTGFWGDDVKDLPQQEYTQGEHPPSGDAMFMWSDSGDDVQRHVDAMDREMSRHFGQMFQDFQELFRHMGPAQFGIHKSFDLPELPESSPEASPESDPHPHQNPRDYMLKKPDSKPEPRERDPGIFVHPSFPGSPFNPATFHSRQDENQDTDLDGQITSVDDLLAPKKSPKAPSHFFRSVSTSVRTYRGSDGTVKREVIKRDSDGNEEREVTEMQGGEVKSVKRWTTKDGDTQVLDDDTNRNDKGLKAIEAPSASDISPLPPFLAGEHKDGLIGKVFKWFHKPGENPKDV